jgi:hypothetical protein
MFFTTFNTQDIEEWIRKNVRNDETMKWFNNISKDTGVVNSLLISSGDIIHLLFRMPDNTFMAITTDDEKAIVSYIRSIATLHAFPNINEVIDNVRAFIRKVETAPNVSMSDMANLFPILPN